MWSLRIKNPYKSQVGGLGMVAVSNKRSAKKVYIAFVSVVTVLHNCPLMTCKTSRAAQKNTLGNLQVVQRVQEIILLCINDIL